MEKNIPRGRFAPSPSGPLHLGNLFCALMAWLSVKKKDGLFVLRIEDLDPDRSYPAHVESCMQALRWLGLDWDEGPGKGGFAAPYEQGKRTALYEKVFAYLESKDLLYPCFCSRAALHAASAPHLSDGSVIYNGACAHLSAAEIAEKKKHRSPAARLRVPDRTYSFADGVFGPYHQNLRTECGDFILRRSDGVFAYQLAVTADDAAMGITEVVRGCDLISSTPRQLYLYDLYGVTPPAFAHIPLLTDSVGNRLAKRDGALGITALQKIFPRPEKLLGHLGFAAGLLCRDEAVSLAELLAEFSFEKIKKTDIRLPAGFSEP